MHRVQVLISKAIQKQVQKAGVGRNRESQGGGTRGLGWRRCRGQALVRTKQIKTNNNTELSGEGSGRLEIKEQTVIQILSEKGIGRQENNK